MNYEITMSRRRDDINTLLHILAEVQFSMQKSIFWGHEKFGVDLGLLINKCDCSVRTLLKLVLSQITVAHYECALLESFQKF